MLESLVANLLNRVLGMYVRNFDPKQLNVGIWSGDVTLRNLELRREALDQFDLPLNVVEGHISSLVVKIPWSNLRGQPVRINIEDVFLLAAPKEDEAYDAAEEEKRTHAVKMEKLDSAELLKERNTEGMSQEEEKKQQSFTAALTTTIIDNVQIQVKNVHIRFEDAVSDPAHPFAAGLTLKELSAVSTDENWRPTWIQSTSATTHKLATLGALAVYWDTDAKLIGEGTGSKDAKAQGIDHDTVLDKFREMIVKSDSPTVKEHQYILKPVSGRAGLEMDKTGKTDRPKTKARLLFNELGFVLDDEQYRDVLMLVDLFHYFIRHQEYRKWQPEKRPKEDPKAWLHFAGKAVLDRIHDKNKRWSWAYFAERRDDRKKYITLFKKKKREEKLTVDEEKEFDALEHKSTYEDLRFWRSLARNALRKENVGVKKPQPASTWGSYIWGGAKKQEEETHDDSQMNEQQRKELYQAIDFDEKKSLTEAVDMPREAVKMQVDMNLKSGGVTLRRDPHGKKTDILRLLFDDFSTEFTQRTDSTLVNLSLGGMRLYDGSTEGNMFEQMLRVKDASPVPESERITELGDDEKEKFKDAKADATAEEEDEDEADPFFTLAFEQNPLDGHADSAVNLKLKAMEIVYNPNFVVQVTKFFKPPAQHNESIGALMEAAGSTVEGLRQQTRAGLEYALQEHKTIDLQLDLQAPLIIVPDSVTKKSTICLILDAGHVSVRSDLIDKRHIEEIQSKEKQKYTEADFHKLEDLMYDKFQLKLESTQVLIGTSVDETKKQVDEKAAGKDFHVVERINVDFTIQNCIIPNSPDLTKVKIVGHLPVLHAILSDAKYKSLMKVLDFAIPKFNDEETKEVGRPTTSETDKAKRRKSNMMSDEMSRVRSKSVQISKDELVVDEEAGEEAAKKQRKAGADSSTSQPKEEKKKDVNPAQRNLEVKFTVDKLQGSLYKSDPEGKNEDQLLVDLIAETFHLEFYQRAFDMVADVRLRSFTVEDHVEQSPEPEFRNLISSEDVNAKEQQDLLTLHFQMVNKEHPEFTSKYEGIKTNLDVALSTINLMVTRKTLLTLLDFALATFAPPDRGKTVGGQPQIEAADELDKEIPAAPEAEPDKIRIKAELRRIAIEHEVGGQGQRPDMEIEGSMSNLNLRITEQQIQFAMELSRNVPKAFALESEEVMEEEVKKALPDEVVEPAKEVDASEKVDAVDKKGAGKASHLGPELGHEEGTWTKLDLVFKVGAIGLELVASGDLKEPIGDLEAASLSKFSLNETSVKLKMLSDGGLESELLVQSFTITDTRTREKNKFRKIMSLINTEVKQQFMASVSISGGEEKDLIALLTVDSPRVILALDYLFAVLQFVNKGMEQNEALLVEDETDADTLAEADDAASVDTQEFVERQNRAAAEKEEAEKGQGKPAGMTISYRVEVVDAQVVLLANPSISNSEAIVLGTKQVLVSQQHAMTLQVEKVGMFLCRMDQFDSSQLRILDDFSIQTSLDMRSQAKDSSLTSIHPRKDKVQHRMLVEVKLGTDNVKCITLRSPLLVENHTQIPLELGVYSPEEGHLLKIEKIAPGEARPAPVGAAFLHSLVVRPGEGFGYTWSNERLFWKDLLKRPIRTLSCAGEQDQGSPPFYFQMQATFDKNNPLTSVYPYMRLRLSAPVEVQNLLPYDFKYRIYDKNTKKDWTNFLRKGGVSPVHVVELSHLLLMSVDMQDTPFRASEFAIINSSNEGDFRREKTLLVKDEKNLELRLKVHYYNVPDSGGAFKITIYAPYIILNRSGLSLDMRSKAFFGGSKASAGGQSFRDDEEDARKATPFMFSFPTDDRANRALIRLGDSAWSQPVSFDAIGAIVDVKLAAASGRAEMHAGLNVMEGEGKYKLTKVVTITPRFIVKNRLTEEIQIREPGSSDFATLKPGELHPLRFLKQSTGQQLCLCFPGVSNNVHVKLAKAGERQKLIRVEILMESAMIYLHLSLETKHWPFSIRNESDQEFFFWQANPNVDEDEEDRTSGWKPIKYRLPPRSIMPYAWDYPATKNKNLVINAHGKERHVKLAEIGNLVPMRIQAAPGQQQRQKVIDLNVVAEGPTQTLALSNYKPSKSLYKQKAATASSSTTQGFEVKEQDIHETMAATLRFEAGIGISLVNAQLHELIYVTWRDIKLEYKESPLYQTVTLTVRWIQIDNQLYGGIFPLIFYPSVVPKTGKEMNAHPIFRTTVTRVKDDSYGVMYIKYFTFLLQQMTIEIDEDFIFALLDFSKIPGASWTEEKEGQLAPSSLDIPEPQQEQSGQDIYFELLQLQPMQFDLSFVRTERINAEDTGSSSSNPFMFAVNVLTMSIGNVNDAPIRYNALMLENARLSVGALISSIQSHYVQESLRQVHIVIGSADFLGNPVGLFNNISSGVADIFYEPYQGLVTDRPQDLGIGIAKGASSFVKKSVFGLSDSVSKFTGSISKGLAAASMDKEFQDQRRNARSRNRPKHALYGITSGGNAFASSLASGIGGMARQPMQGAEKDGAAGFVKGVGMGLLGLATKPAIGAFDLASNMAEGVKNTTTVFDQEGLDRVRYPRFIGTDGVVRPYSQRESVGQFWLKTTDNGKYFNEHYIAHLELDSSSQGDQQLGGNNNHSGKRRAPGQPQQSEAAMLVIVTYSLIMQVRARNLTTVWDVPLKDVQTISKERTGMSIILKGGTNGPFVPIADEQSRNWLYKQVAVAVNAYNDRWNAKG
ncbi:Vacuolar protein sorting-associated protein 13 [Rachicladosporium monterosium]|uniref:Vacuolar protein sorting-associated protein 13 n=1 Tax=Rachicladosporium monterosium TaxID=1507873 RepID=A0ABR0L2I6_9PEZI|nr:Vacuolar protein sorting-associated protein 13 [Rachicladosporium monterosium]